ncbi:MAG: tRNA (adenosine(37)-N6)-dimethylallyltransferase MiaA [Candidatus Binatia bacterium]
MKPKIVIILGPTAVGKSDLALELSAHISGEIVNADSQQVYRYMDIGTGKPSIEDRECIRHHLIDVVNPDEEFNAAMFSQLATEVIWQVHERNHGVVVCGGTGLYIKALTRGLFRGPGQDPELRQSFQREIDEKGLGPLYRRLFDLDPTVASSIHPNDRQRTIRALEVFQLTGKPLSHWQREHAFREEAFEALKIGLNRERGELYDRINRRSERMIQDGLLEEVRALVNRGYSVDLKPLRSVGYLQMGRVLAGTQELPAAIEQMKQDTRRLAKRQLTWFRGDREVLWYHPNQRQEILETVNRFFSP